ncbi:hypothetical protein [Pandoraea sp. SD6-2]|uniref:hypothetical protein n=1 Tax=Pandoraea sp. SD6-2 TaxID=1286093 RepID=UPI001186976C|nr:hypothetical protein [Pandoraea sp. SD6-2]
MENPALYRVLLEELEANGVPAADIQVFAKRWAALGPHDRLLCPLCYLKGHEAPLRPLPEEDGEDPVTCERCEATFYVPME